jgi:hypothetical protein
MNIEKDFSSDQPKFSDEIMTKAMGAIHDMLIEPMQGKLTQEQDAVLALIGLTFKIMAEKATELEKLQEGFNSTLYGKEVSLDFVNQSDFNRN